MRRAGSPGGLSAAPWGDTARIWVQRNAFAAVTASPPLAGWGSHFSCPCLYPGICKMEILIQPLSPPSQPLTVTQSFKMTKGSIRTTNREVSVVVIALREEPASKMKRDGS